MTTRQRFGVLLLSTVLYGVLIASRHRGPGLPAPPPPMVVTPEMNRAAESVTRFSLDLFRRVAARTDDNLILSPYSLAGPLHLLIEGARGKTAREIGNVLHLPATSADPNNAELPWRTSETSLAVAQLNRRLMSRDDALPQSHLEALRDLEQQLSAVQQRIRSRSTRFWQDDFATERELVERVNAWRTRYKPFELGVAHALWVDQRFPLRPDYLTVATDVFNAGLFSVDFHKHSDVTRERVNAWVAEQTRSRIASVLPPGLLSRETRMLLTNATYFRGEWLHPFPAHLTRHEDFTTGKGVTTQGPLMSTSGEFRYAEFRPDGSLNELEKIPAGAESVYAFNWNLPANPDGVKVVEVPYKGDLLTFVALLPGKPDGFSALESQLDFSTLSGWIDRATVQNVELYLPRFQVESMLDVKDDLSAMGMTSAFESGEFTGISDAAESQRLSVANVAHAVGIEVNEKGTEAFASAVPVAVAAGVLPEPPKPPAVFRADHPFVFLIRDAKTGAILFVGRISNPHVSLGN